MAAALWVGGDYYTRCFQWIIVLKACKAYENYSYTRRLWSVATPRKLLHAFA